MLLGPAARRALVLAAGLAAMVAGQAAGQVDPVALEMSAEPTQFTLDPGASGASVLTLRNRGSLDGRAQLTLDGQAQGWGAALSEETVDVPAGGSAEVQLTLRAPAGRANVSESLAVAVRAVLADTTGRFTDQAEVQVRGSLSPPPLPPPPPEFPWIPVLGASAAVVGVVAAALVVRRRETGIKMVVSAAEQEIHAGRDAYVGLEVRNTSRRPRVAQVAASNVPEGWAAGMNRTTVELAPGQAESLWLAVRPPISAPGGEATVSVSAKPVEARRAPVPRPVTFRVIPAFTPGEAPSPAPDAAPGPDGEGERAAPAADRGL